MSDDKSSSKKTSYKCTDSEGKEVSVSKAAMPTIIGVGIAGLVLGMIFFYSSNGSASPTSQSGAGFMKKKGAASGAPASEAQKKA